jgi:hypothetical protein
MYLVPVAWLPLRLKNVVPGQGAFFVYFAPFVVTPNP